MGVIFRRGPTRWIQLINWDTRKDVFEEGQWFHGHIYIGRSDLSPSGSLLIYFANKFNKKTVTDKEYTYAWTAVSKPPFLTALALWPKGDCWHGGGLFRGPHDVFLNHRPADAKSHPLHPPKGLRVMPNPQACGEDDPIRIPRMERDGWQFKQWLDYDYYGHRTLNPVIMEKPNGEGDLKLRVEIYQEPEEQWVCSIVTKKGKEFEIGLGTWADFDQGGRLVFASGGKLFSAFLKSGEMVMDQLADFNASKPRALKAPKWATQW